MLSSCLGNVVDEGEDNGETPLSPDLLWSSRNSVMPRTAREFFHSGGVPLSYKVGFATGSLLHSVAKVFEKRISGVRVFERGREDVGRRSENTGGLLYLGGLRAAIVWRSSLLLTSPGASGEESYAT